MQPTLADIHAAAKVIRGVADATPLVPSPFMSDRSGMPNSCSSWRTCSPSAPSS